MTTIGFAKLKLFRVAFILTTSLICFQTQFLFAQNLSSLFNTTKTIEGLTREGNIQIGLVSDRSAIKPGTKFTIGVQIEHDPGWHTYWQNPGDTGLPTKIAYNFSVANDLWKVGPIQWPTPTKFVIGPLANYGYGNNLVLLQDIVVPGDIVTDSVKIDVNVAWLVCEDVCIPGNKILSIRLPVEEDAEVQQSADSPLIESVKKNNPKEDSFFSSKLFWSHDENYEKVYIYSSEELINDPEFFPLKKGLIIPAAMQSFRSFRDIRTNTVGWWLESRLNTEVPEVTKIGIDSLEGLLKFSDGSAKYINIAYRNLDKKNLEVFDTGFLVEKKANSGTNSDYFPEPDTGFLVSLMFAFFGGLILNLMPCVFPVIGIKILSLIKTSSDTLSGKINIIGFSFGILTFMLIFSVLFIILRNSGTSVGWGFQLQNSSFVLCLIFLFFLLALNLFGFFEFGTSLTSLSSYDRFSGFIGSFVSGALTVLVATPCTAPFMGSALGYAVSASNAELIFVFLSLGLGIAFPYAFLTINPRLINLLPKPGNWMILLREFLGFPMLISVGWLLLVYVELEGTGSIFQIFLILSLITLFFWHKKNFPKTGKMGVRVFQRTSIIGLILLVTIAISTYHVFGSHFERKLSNETIDAKLQNIEWVNWKVGLPEKFLQKGDTVLLDFTATWCITCQVNKVRVLEDNQVINLLFEKKIKLIRADWTKQNKEIENEIKKYGRIGVPLNILLRPGKDPFIFSEWLDKDEFVDLLRD